MMSLKKKKEKILQSNIFNKYEAPFANICLFNFGLNFFMSRAYVLLQKYFL